MWDKVRNAAQETTPQIAPRNCSKEVVGKVNICDFGKGGVHAIKLYINSLHQESFPSTKF